MVIVLIADFTAELHLKKMNVKQLVNVYTVSILDIIFFFFLNISVHRSCGVT